MTFLIAVPTGVKFFNWIGTMWGGSISFDTPMLWSIGFLTTFLFGGLTGVILASPPLDFHVSDSYFVVAHFHYVVFGTVVFAMFAGLLLLVAEADRADARRAPGQGALLDAVHRLPHDVPGPALAGRRGHAPPVSPTTCPTTASPRSTRSRRSARSCSAPRRCRSSTTSGSRATRRWSRSTTRGAGAARWSGRPAVRRRGTTSTASRASAPSRRPSTCTIPEIAAIEMEDNYAMAHSPLRRCPRRRRARRAPARPDGR